MGFLDMQAWQVWWQGFYLANQTLLDVAGMAAMMLLFIVVLLVMIAFILLFDRKVWAAVQMRRGPNVVGPFGLLQSFADLFKFVFKEFVMPAGANKGVFLLAPLITTTLALGAWAVVPVNAGWVFADTIANDRPHPIAQPFGLNRFQEGRLIDESVAAAVAH
jgi:NADH:ubiquinone oxidoreductase subunit H